ncbi:MAG: hypothetical protein Q8O22_00310 [Candidatus Omnitrophota bacterium]|nr:hypothetical protein [Candidatus Omnitrophota bacterium]
MKNWEKKELVRDLRGQGFSYKEIGQKTPFTISKSTVSDWCKDIELTSVQKERLNDLFRDGNYRGRLAGSKATQMRRQKEVDDIKEKARLEIDSLTRDKLKLAGLMLYWAEGNKKHHVGVSNSDPEMIRFVMKWFREIYGVPDAKFKVYLNIHSGQNELQIKEFWSDVIKLPVS